MNLLPLTYRVSKWIPLIIVIVLGLLVLMPPLYSATGSSQGEQFPPPSTDIVCPTGYECLTNSGVVDKYGLMAWGDDKIYEKYSDDACGSPFTATSYCFKWLKPCPTGYECLTEDAANDKFGVGSHRIASTTLVCGYENEGGEFAYKRFCYQSTIIEPTDEKGEVNVCFNCPDPNVVGLGKCIGYECSGPDSALHYKRETIGITECIYENGSVVFEEIIDASSDGQTTNPDYLNPKFMLIKIPNDGVEEVLGDGYPPYFEDTCSWDSVKEYFCQSTTRETSGPIRFGSTNTQDHVWSSTVSCPYGCDGGACICSDDDGFQDFYKKGSVKGSNLEDTCSFDKVIEKDAVIENDQCKIKESEYLCTDADRICEGGACVIGGRCDNGIQDTGEVGVDCGGDCEASCCGDGVKNGLEVGVDCGGECLPCDVCGAANAGNVPSSFDWRNWQGKNWVSPIKDQARCGSCWAQAAVGLVETVYNIQRIGDVINVDLSEQYAVSDGAIEGSCEGGRPNYVFDYMQEEDGGIPWESDFPYQSQMCMVQDPTGEEGGSVCNNPCIHGDDCSNPEGISSNIRNPWRLKDYTDYDVDVSGLQKLVACRPVVVSSSNWAHAVIVIGWDNGSDICEDKYGMNGCWIIKNSHGNSTGWYTYSPGAADDVWHENGFAYIPYYGHPYSDIVDRSVWDISGVFHDGVGY